MKEFDEMRLAMALGAIAIGYLTAIYWKKKEPPKNQTRSWDMMMQPINPAELITEVQHGGHKNHSIMEQVGHDLYSYLSRVFNALIPQYENPPASNSGDVGFYASDAGSHYDPINYQW